MEVTNSKLEALNSHIKKKKKMEWALFAGKEETSGRVKRDPAVES